MKHEDWYSIRSGTFSIPKDLNRGLVCSRDFFPVMCLILFFWRIWMGFSLLDLTPPQQGRPYSKWDLKIELYIVFLIVVGNRFLTLERAKLAEDSFPLTCFKCGSHDKNSSKWMPTNLKELCVHPSPILSIVCPFILSSRLEKSTCWFFSETECI